MLLALGARRLQAEGLQGQHSGKKNLLKGLAVENLQSRDEHGHWAVVGMGKSELVVRFSGMSLVS